MQYETLRPTTLVQSVAFLALRKWVDGPSWGQRKKVGGKDFRGIYEAVSLYYGN